MSEQWKRWECPVCRVVYDDPWHVYATTCDKGHMLILGNPTRSDGLWTWASLDDHFYTPQQLQELATPTDRRS